MAREVAVYDLRKLRGLLQPTSAQEQEAGQDAQSGGSEGGEALSGADHTSEGSWEEVDEADELAYKIRRTKKFPFEVAEFAVDPGQDLLVVVEVK